MTSMVDMWKMQKSIGYWCDKNFPNQDVSSIETHFQEEAQELQRAIYAPFCVPSVMRTEVGEEIADCIILLLALAENLGINASDEVRKKMTENWKRKFAYDPSKGYHKRTDYTDVTAEDPR